MRTELLNQWENKVPGDFSLDILDPLLDAVENLPIEQRDELVTVALDAWQEAADKHDART